MKTNFLSRINQWVVFLLLTLFAAAIVVASVQLINYLKKEEIKRINLLSKAIKIQQEITSPDPAILELLPDIHTSNNTIPVIVTDKMKKRTQVYWGVAHLLAKLLL